MKYSFLKTIILFLCIALSSCKNDRQSETEERQTQQNDLKIDSSIILEVGEEKLTVFELQKNFKLFKQTNEQEYHRAPTEADIKLWIKEFGDRAYILADARDLGYYKRKDIQAIVENTASMMLVQPHGLFEKWLTSGLKPADIEKAIDHTKNENKERVEARLKRNIVGNYFGKINRLTSLEVDRSAMDFLGKILKKNKNTHQIKMNDISAVSDKALATYNTPAAKKAAISMVDFMEYYNSLPIKKILKDTGMVKMYLQNIATSTHVQKDAEKRGLLNDPEFKMNKKNFNDNVVYQKYREEQLSGTAPVSEEDILKTYGEVKSKMLRPAGIVYSIFTFSSFQKASDARWLLQRNPNNAKLKLNALSEARHIKFEEDSEKLADTLRKNLFGLQPGQICIPVEINDYYTILLMESSSGNVPFQLNEIRPYLINIITDKRTAENERKRLAVLSRKYKKTGVLDIKLISGI
jgi:hypothetical protein